MRALLLCFALVSAGAAGAGADRGELAGTIRDAAGKPLTGAAVKIRNLDRGVTVTVFSRAGRYRAAGLFPGKTEVSAGPDGHAPGAERTIEIATGKAAKLDLALRASDPVVTTADWIPQLPDDGDGAKQLVVNRCVNCHGPVNFVSRRFDQLGWKKVILDMGRIEETRKARWREIPDEQAMAAKGEEIERLSRYLARHYGPDKAPQVQAPKPVAYRSTRGATDIVITQFDIPTRGAVPHNVASDAAGRVWFVERFADKVGMLDPQTAGFRELPIPTGARPHGVIADAGGIVWWTESRGNHLGRLDPRSGEMKRYPLPHERSGPHSLALARDGAIWLTEIGGNRIARFDPAAGRFTEHEVPTKRSRPYGIAIDARGDVWFCEFTGDRIGRLDPATGRITEYAPPTPRSGPRRLRIDAEGGVWFTEYNTNRIARLEPATGAMREWTIPTPDSGPYDIAVDARGMVWFDEFTANKIVRFDPATARFDEFPLPGPDSQVRKMAFDPSGALWLSEYTGSRMVRVVER
ncbi:MAG TPA: carboxypeptidase regulatory-like domain-containing protein [Burkholderiales bacterium]